MIELTPGLDSQSEVPLYMQLYHYIKKEMKEGNLPATTKLPSKRKLASHLQISQNTIEAAYNQLVAEGYIESLPRKGYFVCEVEQDTFDLEESLNIIKEKPHREREYRYDFTHTGIDAPSFPFSIYRKLAGEVLRSEDGLLLRLGHPQGELRLREAISEVVFESRGVRCSPSQIVIGAGTPYLMKLLFQLLKGNVFAVEDPGYHRKLVECEHKEEQVRLIPLDDEGVILPYLEKCGANVVFVTPSHQFPCGMIMPIARRGQLLKWAKEKEDRYIIEDDYDSEFRYSGKPIPALQGLDTNGKVIYMGTFSKALLPSLRISYMVLPKQLIRRYQNEYFFFSQTVSRIDQEILWRFLREGYWEKHIHKMRAVYQKKRNALVSAIATYFPKSAEIIGQDSGLHLLVRPNNGMEEQELISEAAKFDVKVYPVSDFGQSIHHTVLLGFAVISDEEINDAVQLLARAWFKR